MDVASYNEKIVFVVEKGDLSTDGVLYRTYRAAFDEWYGEQIAEDVLIESGYPENDFKEWFKSRLMDSSDEKEFDTEISESFLDDEIEQIYLKSI